MKRTGIEKLRTDYADWLRHGDAKLGNYLIHALGRPGEGALDEIERLRKINGEAVRLLHMLDDQEARHPDVALFLDGLDPDAGPE